MAHKSAIEWTDDTWNPLAGCTPVSDGCRNCYAATMALRLEAMGQAKYAEVARRTTEGRAVFTGHINYAHGDAVALPLTWKRPKRIFVNSMSDLFHEAVPERFISQVYTTMEAAYWHTFMVLTKRPERMAEYTTWRTKVTGAMPANIWHGTSVENQKAADERIPHLLRVPAAVRFLSCEPLLGPVDLEQWVYSRRSRMRHLMHGPACLNEEQAAHSVPPVGIHWVIVGGESGTKARPMHPDWARGLRDQAVATGAAYFFKQWGEWAPLDQLEDLEPSDMDQRQAVFDDGPRITTTVRRVGKSAAGRLLDGRTWEEVPQ